MSLRTGWHNQKRVMQIMLGDTKQLVTLAVKLWNQPWFATAYNDDTGDKYVVYLTHGRKGGRGEGGRAGGKRRKGGREGEGRELQLNEQMKDIPACPVSLDKVKMATSDGPYSTGAGMGVNWGQ